MLQIVHEFFDADLTVARVEQLAELSLRHGITTTLSPLFDSDANPSAVDKVMAAVEAARARGAAVWPQVQTRPIDISFTLEQRSLMLLTMPSWWKVASIRDHDERIAAVTTQRDALVAEMNGLAQRPNGGLGAGAFVVRQTMHERNIDLVGRNIDSIATERGVSHGDAIVDLALDEDLGTWFIRESIGHNNSPVVGELLAHPFVHVGASDGGAHVGSFSTFGDTGFLFSEFVRGTGSLTLEEAVKKITLDPATIWGMPDRGRLVAAPPPTWWSSTPTRSAADPRSHPTTSRARASAGSVARRASTPSSSTAPSPGRGGRLRPRSPRRRHRHPLTSRVEATDGSTCGALTLDSRVLGSARPTRSKERGWPKSSS